MRRRKLFMPAAVVAAFAVFATANAPAPSMPCYETVRRSWAPSDVRILDRRGEVIHEARVDSSVRRLAWTPLDEISPALVRAVTESEDRRFSSHAGVDWRAVAAAAWQSVGGGPPRGASTITMQLAALVDPSLRRGNGPRGPTRKWQQMRAAFALEEDWSKAEILEAYLNLVGFRGEVEGVRAAAETVFGKAPHGLTIEESVALAASIRAPGAAAATLERRAKNLAARLRSGDVGLVEAASMRLAGPPSGRGPRAALLPHAARMLLRDSAGNDVRASIDARIQVAAAASLRRHVLEIRDRSASDGAVLVVDNASGEVLAYVGSTGGLSGAPEVDGVRAPRQAGSTLKPFLYALALDEGLVTAATLLEDTPLELAVGDTVYRPENYDHRFRGLVPVRAALAASLNVPAVRTLTLLGEERFAETLRALRVGGVKESGDWYGPSLALGSVDVTLWDLVGAYRAMARGGVWGPLRLELLGAASTPGAGARVFDTSTAWIVGDMLSDRGSRSATFHLDGPLSTRFWTAVKTGTSKDMRDNWCVGWSGRYTVGVWVGNFSGEPMHDVSGTSGAAPIWREVMDVLHEDEAGEQPAIPGGVVGAWTAFAGGSEPPRREWYREGTEPWSASRPGRAPAAGSGSDARAGETVVAEAAGLDSHPRILSPSDGSVLSLDPDIRPERQRVVLVAYAATEGMTWKLGDRTLGSAASPLPWEPRSGSYELVLADSDGTRLDAIRFKVNGPRPRKL